MGRHRGSRGTKAEALGLAVLALIALLAVAYIWTR